MSKYLPWILKESHVEEDSDLGVCDESGRILKRVRNTFQCPYCGEAYTDILSAQIDFRKCRYCGHPVSPYPNKNSLVATVWVEEE